MAMMSPSFYKLLLGQTVSWFGTLIGRLALPFVVIYILKASALDIAWVRLAEMVPGALVGLFVGVWVDRLASRLILVVSDVARACLAFTVPLAIAFDYLTLLLVVVVAGLMSLFTVSFDVAYEAYLPELVPGRDLVTANRYLSAGGSVAEVMGFAVAGLLFESTGGAWTLSVDAMTYVLSAWSLLTIRATATTAPKTTQSRQTRVHWRTELVQGLTTLNADPQLVTLTAMGVLLGAYSGISSTVYMLLVSRGLGVAPGIQGILYAVGGLGALAAAALAGRTARHLGIRGTLIAVSWVGLMGTALLPLAAGPDWLVILFVLGQQIFGDGADTLYHIHATSLRQTLIENSQMGRVNSAWHVARSTAVVLGVVAGGLLAGDIGLRGTFWIAVGFRAAAALWAYRLRPCREVHV
jgi:MFS family permease